MTRDQEVYRDAVVDLNASIDRFFVVADAQKHRRTDSENNIVRQLGGAQKWLRVWLSNLVLQNT